MLGLGFKAKCIFTRLVEAGPRSTQPSYHTVCMRHSRLAYLFLDEGDVHQRRVGVNELKHESLRDQVVLVLRVRAVVFLPVIKH